MPLPAAFYVTSVGSPWANSQAEPFELKNREGLDVGGESATCIFCILGLFSLEKTCGGLFVYLYKYRMVASQTMEPATPQWCRGRARGSGR